MSYPVPLAVRVFNDSIDHHITNQLQGLSFRSAIPGGYASARLRFAKPLAKGALEALPYTHMQICDKRTARVVWQGRIEDPTPSVDSEGQVWEMVAIGPSARAQDITTPRVYIETSLDGFYTRNRFVAAASSEVGSTPDAGPTSKEAAVITAPGGTVLGNGIVGALYYDGPAVSGQQIGGVQYTRIAGRTDTGYQNELALFAADGTPTVETPTSQNFNAVAATGAAKVVGTDWTAGMDIVRLTVRRSGGATTVADDTTWGAFYDLYVATRRLLIDGSFAPNADHANAYVLAAEVIADLIGSGLLGYDAARSTISSGANDHIDQLAYPDGVTPWRILDDLMLLESGYFWAAWEGDPARFEWGPWPTTITYEADIADGYQAPTSTTELFNEVEVRYKNKRGRVTSLVATSTVETLDNAGLTRRAFIDLGSEIGSAANAAQVADRFLLDHAFPPNAGTITLSRPVLNFDTGRLEQPWEVLPGRLIRVRGVEPNPDALNATDRDGVTVMRIMATDYDGDANAVVCELDSYSQALSRSFTTADRGRQVG